MRDSLRVLIALVAALAVGIAIGVWGNAGALAAVDFVAPVGALWVTAIRMTVIPLVVSLLVTGVASAVDVRAIGKLGARTLAVFLVLLTLECLVFIPLAPLVFAPLAHGARPALPPGAVEAAGQITASEGQSFAAWLGSLLPSNPIAAAASGQMVPIVLFTLLLALAIARSAPASRATLVGFFTALGEAMMKLVTWVIAAAPIGVFALVLPLAAHAGAALAGAMGYYIVAYSLGCIAGTLLLYPAVALLGRVPFGRFARAAVPSQVIALSSSSSIASLPALVESAERRLGIGPRVSGFVLPLAVSVFHVSGAVTWSFGAVFAGWFYGVPLGASKLLMIALYAIFLGFAGPGVPRGGFIMLTPLFLALGLPAQGIGLLIALDAIPDTFSTVLNVTGDLAATAIVARSAEDTVTVRSEVGAGLAPP